MQIVKSLMEMNEYDKAIEMLELCLQSNNNEDWWEDNEIILWTKRCNAPRLLIT